MKRVLTIVGVALIISAGLIAAAAAWPGLTSRFTTSSTVTSASSASVSIPRVGISSRLVDGKDSSALARGVWRDPKSGKPGTSGTCIVAGHRIAGQFAALGSVRKGDRVDVRYAGHRYLYRVTEVHVVGGSTRLTVIAGTRRLTLYTCTPRWKGDKRVVVYAKLLGVH